MGHSSPARAKERDPDVCTRVVRNSGYDITVRLRTSSVDADKVADMLLNIKRLSMALWKGNTARRAGAFGNRTRDSNEGPGVVLQRCPVVVGVSFISRFRRPDFVQFSFVPPIKPAPYLTFI